MCAAGVRFAACTSQESNPPLALDGSCMAIRNAFRPHDDPDKPESLRYTGERKSLHINGLTDKGGGLDPNE